MIANTTPPSSQLFNLAQTFFIDPSVAGGATSIGISAIDLFFMFVPAPFNNTTGVHLPGVSVFLAETYNGVPVITPTTYGQIARAEYSTIAASSDASLATQFRFANPIQVPTGKTYAFLVSFDQNEQFVLWHEEKGFPLVGTLQSNGNFVPCPGPSSQYCGSYFEYVSTSATSVNEPEYNPLTGEIEWNPEPIILDGGASGTQAGFTWGSLPSLDLKFRVYGAQYSVNSVPIFSNTGLGSNTSLFSGQGDVEVFYDANTGDTTIAYPSFNYEFFTFNLAKSTRQLFVGAQRIYQNTVPFPGGNSVATVSVNMSNVIIANTQTSNGQPFSWNAIFGTYAGPKFVTFIGQNDTINIRQVTSILSNTQITVDEPTTFVNARATFMITPVAQLTSWDQSTNWGTGGDHLYYMFARSSTANSTVRFTSDSIDHTQSTANSGNGYSNSDVLYVLGYEYVAGKVPSVPINGVGNHPAHGNLVTNSTGGVTGIQWANIGAGFTNTATINIVVSAGPDNNPTTNSSNGTGLAAHIVVGSTICTELTNNVLVECKTINIDVEASNPSFILGNSTETEFSLFVESLYTVEDDDETASGFLYRVVPAVNETAIPVIMDTLNHFSNAATAIPCYVSYSNQFQILYANGAINDQVNPLALFDNSFVFFVTTSSVSDYVALNVNNSPFIEYTKYIVNDDYSGENTNNGNALAKHITQIINFAGNNGLISMAEDIRVYLTAYKPSATDLECYARIQNSTDPQSFNSTEWTRLDLINGNDIYSSPVNLQNYIELTFGFPQYPNVDLICPGTVTIGNNTSNIVGSNTQFNVTQGDGHPMLMVGDLVKIYDPLFPEQNHAVCMVTNVYSNTVVGVDSTFVSNFEFGVGGPALTNVAGLRVARTRNYTHQAFNNIQNDNVCRYYNTSTTKFDGYDILQIKVVFLSNDLHQIPRLHSLRGIGLSA